MSKKQHMPIILGLYRPWSLPLDRYESPNSRYYGLCNQNIKHFCTSDYLVTNWGLSSIHVLLWPNNASFLEQLELAESIRNKNGSL